MGEIGEAWDEIDIEEKSAIDWTAWRDRPR